MASEISTRLKSELERRGFGLPVRRMEMRFRAPARYEDEVAVRTRELEERSVAIEQVALDALAAAKDWEGTEAALTKLAEELGAPREELALELKRRRAGA